ncbi:MAG TPA: NAD(P)-dependent oxidoreductase [Nocardioidaceae bacterium]|jgi:3-hydroxyisobutyrate dehydrogenase-like beta-hydroxyacid dehydrogenase
MTETTGASAPTIGVIGLGAMGRPITEAQLQQQRTVWVLDLNPAAVKEAANAGAHPAASIGELAQHCPTVILSLPTPQVVRSVVDELAAAPVVPLVLDTSTIDPDTAQGCQQTMRRVGGDYADTPILGRPSAVGNWTVPVGAAPEVTAQVEEALRPVAKRILRVGEVGTSSTLKVLNNLMLGAINAVTAEVLVLAEAAGLDPGVFVDTVLESGAASVSGLFKDVAPRAVDGDFRPTFSVDLMRKDNGLALALAEKHQVPMPVGTAAQMLNTMTSAAGYGQDDSIAAVKLLEQISGRRARRHTPEGGPR